MKPAICLPGGALREERPQILPIVVLFRAAALILQMFDAKPLPPALTWALSILAWNVSTLMERAAKCFT